MGQGQRGRGGGDGRVEGNRCTQDKAKETSRKKVTVKKNM